MYVVMLSLKDYAGSGWKIADAINQTGQHKVFHATRVPHQFGYPSDAVLEEGGRLAITRAIKRADIVHFKGDEPPTADWWGVHIPKGLPRIVSVGGSSFRRLPGGVKCKVAMGHYPLSVYVAEADIRTALTPDLNYPDFRGTYTQQCIDANRQPYLWKRAQKVIISHSPSVRSKKGTEMIIEAVRRLQDEGFRVELDIIEGVSNAECVQRKRRATLFIDQISDTGYYGISALEAMQFGVPVMAHISEQAIAQSEGKLNGLPVIRVNKSATSVYFTLKHYLENMGELADLSILTKHWADTFHSYEQVGAMWSEIYNTLN